jgi:hypothetical protein
MVSVASTIGSEIILDTNILLDAPMVPQGDEAQVEACFGPFGDSANLNTR